MSIRKCLWLLLPVTVILSGCSVTVSDLVGDYRANNKQGYATLSLHSDQTYEQAIYPNGSQPKKIVGKWKVDQENMVTLLNAFSVQEDVLDLRVGAVTMDASKILGRVTIECAPECYYRKQ